MKNYIYIYLISITFSSFGQYPVATPLQGSIAPISSPFLNGETVSFEITMTAFIDMTWPPPGMVPFDINITTVNLINISVASTGSTGDYFDVIVYPFDPSISIIEITQNKAIPLDSFIKLTINGTVSGTGGQSVGYNLNVHPGGYSFGGGSFSSIGVISGTLPVALADFNVKAEGKMANLKWSTAEETGSDHFQIQYSLDAKTWVTKGLVTAAGDSKSVTNYTFADSDVANGNNYYRLKIVDKDGTFATNKAKSVYFEGIEEKLFEVYPNPTTSRFSIQTPEWSKVRGVQIMSPNGREVYRSGDKPNADISVNHLPNGVYTVKVTYSNQTQVVKRLAIQN